MPLTLQVDAEASEIRRLIEEKYALENYAAELQSNIQEREEEIDNLENQIRVLDQAIAIDEQSSTSPSNCPGLRSQKKAKRKLVQKIDSLKIFNICDDLDRDSVLRRAEAIQAILRRIRLRVPAVIEQEREN